MLEDQPDIDVVGEGQDGEEAIALAQEKTPDVMLMDVEMPKLDGVEATRRILESNPGIKVLVLTIHAEEQLAVRVLKAGASGYLTKENAPGELVKAIRKVVSGGKYISRGLAETLAFNLDVASDRPLHEALSDREFQVMQMMAGGKTLTEIADTLSLSVKTVSTYRTRLLQKMNLDTNAEIIRYAIENGLIE